LKLGVVFVFKLVFTFALGLILAVMLVMLLTLLKVGVYISIDGNPFALLSF